MLPGYSYQYIIVDVTAKFDCIRDEKINRNWIDPATVELVSLSSYNELGFTDERTESLEEWVCLLLCTERVARARKTAL
jgi:hypothetical protein